MNTPLDHDERYVVARSTGPAADLAHMLRELRVGRPRRVTQRQLAKALGLSSLGGISSWENVDKPVVPTEHMLERIATFYASPRSVAGDQARVLNLDELSTDERAERDKLLGQLLDVRRQAQRGEPGGGQRGPWHFSDGAVRIFCGKWEAEDLPKFASGEQPNYSALSAYADIDALVELFGHLRSENPAADVQFDLATRLESADLQAHLVVLGGMAWMQGGKVIFLRRGLPVRQVVDPTGELVDIGEVFEVTTDDRVTMYRPQFADDGAVIEDVGFFLRTRGTNSARTLTVCSGVFSRGVYGAVRLLTDTTDQELHESNVAYVAGKLAAASTYGVLMRVPTHDHAIATPDLRDRDNILYEFSLPS
ncbi:MAG TPA: helix-turn-helix domain-containing protein [Pseudonocardia sp.]|jgi:transcriptional regulator with XRE-family HTH domain